MSNYCFGEYVVYCPGYKPDKIGRVTEDRGDSAMVCYHDGCTAASTPKSMLRRATDGEIAEATPHLGHHRFDRFCPDRIDDPPICCGMCRAEKAEVIDDGNQKA